MWQPWIGSNYPERRTLLLLESCYDWVENGVTFNPTHDHPCVLVKEEIGKPLSNAATINKITRAISGCEWPSPERVASAWNKYAFTNYVPSSVGLGSSKRPTESAWIQAEEEWPSLINLLNPQTIIVLSKECWGYMPTTQFRDNEENPYNNNLPNEGYKLANGDVAMCYVIQHPSRGLSHDEYAKFIRYAEGLRLNSVISRIK